ncbi:MAG: efflux RND transporter periplasmic adaptor subunit [Lewinella sp.]|nr:efflux RND transporter periplasmic adaptor subunit [Lewinella sp.]
MYNVRTILYSLLLAPLAVLLWSCEEEAPPIGNGATASSVLEVDYVVLRPQPVANQLSLTGTLLASESADLSPQIAGLIKTISFREGDWVRAGQELVKLDDRQYLAQQQKLNAQLETARKDLERKEQLLAINGISQAEVDNAELLIASLEADLLALDVTLDYTIIRAPFNGQIGLRSVSPGVYLSAGSPVIRLVQTNPLRLEFNVPERYAGEIREGQPVRFTVAGRDETFQGQVYAAEAVIDEASRALRIRARVPNPDGELIAGAFADIELTLDSIPNALLAPTEAVIPQLNEQAVFQVKGGKAVETKVRTGIRLTRHVQIREGLEAGDTIMVSGLLQARDGLDVKPGEEIIIGPLSN